jgi:hypothetical protein
MDAQLRTASDESKLETAARQDARIILSEIADSSIAINFDHAHGGRMGRDELKALSSASINRIPGFQGTDCIGTIISATWLSHRQRLPTKHPGNPTKPNEQRIANTQ